MAAILFSGNRERKTQRSGLLLYGFFHSSLNADTLGFSFPFPVPVARVFRAGSHQRAGGALAFQRQFSRRRPQPSLLLPAWRRLFGRRPVWEPERCFVHRQHPLLPRNPRPPGLAHTQFQLVVLASGGKADCTIHGHYLQTQRKVRRQSFNGRL